MRTHPTLIQRPRSEWPPSNFGMNVISPETRMMGLPYGGEMMIVGRTMWTQCTSVTDRRTDRMTITKTVQRRASHGKNGLTLYCSCHQASKSAYTCVLMIYVTCTPVSCINSSSNNKRSALFMVVLLLLFAERLASWKMKHKHIRWTITMSSHCMQWFLNQSTMALCWSLFLMDVLKNTLTSTRYCLTWQYVCCLCEKI